MHTQCRQRGAGAAQLSPPGGGTGTDTPSPWGSPTAARMASEGWEQQLTALCRTPALCAALPRDLPGRPCGLSRRLPPPRRPAWGSSCAPRGGGSFPTPPQMALLGCWPQSRSAAGIRFLSHRPAPAPPGPGSGRGGWAMPPLTLPKERGAVGSLVPYGPGGHGDGCLGAG